LENSSSSPPPNSIFKFKGISQIWNPDPLIMRCDVTGGRLNLQPPCLYQKKYRWILTTQHCESTCFLSGTCPLSFPQGCCLLEQAPGANTLVTPNQHRNVHGGDFYCFSRTGHNFQAPSYPDISITYICGCVCRGHIRWPNRILSPFSPSVERGD
jgi:hypothetical protein